MNAPALLPTETVYTNADWRLAVKYYERDGTTATSMVASGVVGECRLSKVGSATTLTRDTSTSGQYAWVTDGTDGEVEYIFLQADLAALSDGIYDVEVFYRKSSSSVLRLSAKGQILIAAGVT